MEYWSPVGLSYIASALGKPLYLDRKTASMSHIAFSRLFVEVEACRGLQKDIDVLGINGRIFTVQVTYDWAPAICSSYGCFGHSNLGCSKGSKPTTKIRATSGGDTNGKEGNEEWNVGSRKGKYKGESRSVVASLTPFSGKPIALSNISLECLNPL